jgi:hypothetical protein
MFSSTRFVTLILSTILLTTAVYANAISGKVIGLWADPLLAGNLLRTTGQTEFFDNTATAQYHINNSPDGSFGSALTWGIRGVGGPQPFSVLNFFGATLTGVPANSPVSLGRITFLNGTSDLNSLIFGAKLILSIKNDLSVDPLAANVTIVTTENTGFDANFDADYFYFDVLFPKTFNVYEGTNATIDVFGQFVGDPQIQLTNILLIPGETGGFIGNGTPQPIPEPATLVVTMAGLAAVAITARRRRFMWRPLR